MMTDTILMKDSFQKKINWPPLNISRLPPPQYCRDWPPPQLSKYRMPMHVLRLAPQIEKVLTTEPVSSRSEDFNLSKGGQSEHFNFFQSQRGGQSWTLMFFSSNWLLISRHLENSGGGQLKKTPCN